MKEMLIQLWPIWLILVIDIILIVWDIVEERRKPKGVLRIKKGDLSPEKIEEFRKSWKEVSSLPYRSEVTEEYIQLDNKTDKILKILHLRSKLKKIEKKRKEYEE